MYILFTKDNGNTICITIPELESNELESYNVAVGSEIRQFFPRSQNYRAFVTNQGHIVATDYDPINRLIYWVDTRTKDLKRALIPRNNASIDVMSYPQNLGITDLEEPAGVAFDWLTG